MIFLNIELAKISEHLKKKKTYIESRNLNAHMIPLQMTIMHIKIPTSENSRHLWSEENYSTGNLSMRLISVHYTQQHYNLSFTSHTAFRF